MLILQYSPFKYKVIPTPKGTLLISPHFKLLLNCPPQERPPYYKATFSLQKGWPYKQAYFETCKILCVYQICAHVCLNKHLKFESAIHHFVLHWKEIAFKSNIIFILNQSFTKTTNILAMQQEFYTAMIYIT